MYGLWCPDCGDYARSIFRTIVRFPSIAEANQAAVQWMTDDPTTRYVPKFVPANVS
jgi:hypothetical protein